MAPKSETRPAAMPADRARAKRVFALVVLGSLSAVGCVGQKKNAALKVPSDLVARLETPAVRTPKADMAVLLIEKEFEIFLTGYSYWDNTPRQSTAIARPIIHTEAGGSGTYQDPITIAVGHRISDEVQSLDYPAGTRFYLPNLQKYAVVEDVCGDGNEPQAGPCHTGHQGFPWLDIYIGGQEAEEDSATDCARQITAIQPILIHPRDDYAVLAGEILQTNCTAVRT